MSVAAGELPQWAQIAIYIATTIVTIAVVVRKGWKQAIKEEPTGTATVLAGSFADKRSLEQLTDELIDLRRVMGDFRSDIHRDVTILVTDIRANTRAIQANTEEAALSNRMLRQQDRTSGGDLGRVD
jgi:hypothetical protein